MSPSPTRPPSPAGAAPAPDPTGTVTFTLFGPGNPTCTGAPIFTSAAVPLPAAAPFTVNSGNFVPPGAGTYNWVAVYSGDANYASVTSPCGAPDEESVVIQPVADIVTDASGPVTLTQPINDVATVTGTPPAAPTPTGTVTFTLFGPGNPTCTGAPIFTSAARPLGGGPPPTATSENFTPTAAGTYNWVAVYSGDATYAAATSPCGAPNEESLVTPLPTISVDKTATPLSLPEPGGDFTFNVVVTNTSTEVLTITSLTDDVYGDLTTRANSTCNTAIGTVLQPTPGPGNTYSCSFVAPFTGNAGDAQTDVVTVNATNPGGVVVTDNDDAVVTITDDPPQIQIVKDATPLTLPEPGGAFTYNLVITNPDTLEAVTVTSLVDDVYGNLDDPANPNVTSNTCVDAVGTVLAPSPGPGNTFSCSFTANFTGNSGDSVTDVATVVGVDDDGTSVTDSDDAVVNLTGVAPAIAIVKTANPLTLPEPGGAFTFNLVITNPSTVEAVTITSLVDDVYGNLDDPANPAVTNNTCLDAVGTVLAVSPGPGNTFSCSFTGQFTGNSGDSQTDTATVVGVDDDNTTVTDTDDAVVDLTDVAPGISIDKVATPLTRPEPGGAFTFNLVVTNTSTLEPVTITSLVDDVYGNLDDAANPAVTNNTCLDAVGTVLQPSPGPGNTFSCSFTGQFTGTGGDAQTDTATVVGVDDDNTSVTDTDDAVVTITAVAPAISIDKTATPLTRPEPGGAFTFNLVVTNPSTVEAVTITSLVDDIYGNLDDPANPLVTNNTCLDAVGTLLAVSPGPGNTFSCSFTGQFTGTGGDAQTDTATVVGVDDDNTTVTDSDEALVAITDVVPAIQVLKGATPLTRPEPGGAFTFDVSVANTGPAPVTITTLTDDVYGNLDDPANPLVTNNTCLDVVGTLLQPGESVSCTFVGQFTGTGGASQIDVVTATGIDDTGEQVSDDDDAIVTITGVAPAIDVSKSADPLTRPEPGGAFTFNVVITNTSSVEAITVTSLTDDVYGNLDDPANPAVTSNTCLDAVGTVLQPGGSFTCSFVGQFTGSGGDTQTDIVTVTGVDDDGETASDLDDATVAITPGPPPTIRVDKTATPLSRPEPGGAFTFNVVVTNTSSSEAITITSLTDNIYGNLDDPNNPEVTNNTCLDAVGTVLQPGGTFSCSFVGQFTGTAGATQTDIVTATGVDDDGETATDVDDAIVSITPGPTPTIRVDKTATPLTRPEPGGAFTFNVVVTNTSTQPITITSLTDDIYGDLDNANNPAVTNNTCLNAVGTVLQPGASFSCSFVGQFTGAPRSQTDVVTVIGRDDNGRTATDNDDAVVAITDVPPSVDVVKTASPLTRPEPGGAFTFTVVVTNTSTSEALTIDTLTDDIYGNLDDPNNSKVSSNTCLNVVGTVLQPGQSVTCTFVGQFTGNARATQTDVVTVSGHDDDNSQATDRDDARVDLTDVPPTVTVIKDADPVSRPAPGGSFTFFVTVTNTSFEPVTLVSLTDDVYGNLNGRGTCAIGGVIQPGASYKCQFTVDFRGAGGATQVDRVFATVVDNDNTQASANDDARISLTPVVVVPPPVQPTAPPITLGRTGSDVGGPARLALGLLVAGLLLLGATWGSEGGRLALAPGGGPGRGPGRGPRGGPKGGSAFTRFTGGGGGAGRRRPVAAAPETVTAVPVFDWASITDADAPRALGPAGSSDMGPDDRGPDDRGPDDHGPDDHGPGGGQPGGGLGGGFDGQGGGFSPPSGPAPSSGGSDGAPVAEWSAADQVIEVEAEPVIVPAPAPVVQAPPTEPPVWTPKPAPEIRITRLL